MYHIWRFIIKEEFRKEEDKDYINAYFTDKEIEERKKLYPEVNWC